ncbi:MAG: SPOR domain-containing protein [Magnetococcales bacterium]|nr:SPOR domain-containing protein [Magnetococcales bacterium]
MTGLTGTIRGRLLPTFGPPPQGGGVAVRSRPATKSPASPPTSSSREQQIFFIAGGIILTLILVLTVFNMFQQDGRERDLLSGVVKQAPPAVVEPSYRPMQATSEVRDTTVTDNSSHGSQISSQDKLIGNWEHPAAMTAPLPRNAKAPVALDRPAPVFMHSYDIQTMEPVKPAPAAEPVKPAPSSSFPAPALKQQAMATATAVDTLISTTESAAAQPIPAAGAATDSQVEQPAKTVDGFTVQFGSYSDTANAGKMVQRLSQLALNGKPVHAYQSPVVAEQGRTYYRVRVGPFTTYDEADRAGRFLQQKSGHAARVVQPGR